VLEAMEAGNCYRTSPLEARSATATTGEVLDGPRLSVVDDDLGGRRCAAHDP